MKGQEKGCDREGGEPHAAEDKRQTPGKTRRLSISLCLVKKRGTKKIENESSASSSTMRQRKENLEKHIDCRGCWQDEGFGSEKKGLVQDTRKKDTSLDERLKKFLSSPSTTGGCHGLRIIFSDAVERMTERSDPIVVDQNAIQQATETGNACKPFAWSIPAELLKILVVPDGGRGTNTAIGIAQNVKEVENVVVARGGGSRSAQVGLAQAARQGIMAGESKTKVRYLDGQLTWNMSSATETETRISAAWNAWHMLGQFWKRKKAGGPQVQVQRLQSNHTGLTAVRLVRF